MSEQFHIDSTVAGEPAETPSSNRVIEPIVLRLYEKEQVSGLEMENEG